MTFPGGCLSTITLTVQVLLVDSSYNWSIHSENIIRSGRLEKWPIATSNPTIYPGCVGMGFRRCHQLKTPKKPGHPKCGKNTALKVYPPAGFLSTNSGL